MPQLKEFALSELSNLRDLNLSYTGPNRIFVYFSFWLLVKMKGRFSVTSASKILGEDIPKQVFAKAKKVFKYVDGGYPYIHEDKKIVLDIGDFDAPNPTKEVMTVYGHIASWERNPDIAKLM